MSVNVWVVARRELSEADHRLIAAYDTLAMNRLEIPQDLKDVLLRTVGKAPENGWSEPYSEVFRGMIEVTLYGEGKPEYGDGMIIKMADLPPGTVELRVYMS